MEKEIKRLAAYSVYRELCDSSHHQDEYDVVRDFVMFVMLREPRKYVFELEEIQEGLECEFGINIPSYIIVSALKHSAGIQKQKDKYHLDIKQQKSSDGITSLFEKKETKCKRVEEDLISFIERKKKLTETERKEVLEALIEFLLTSSLNSSGKKNDGRKYTTYISAFIAEVENDEELRLELETLREGAVLLYGLTYSGNISEKSAWRNNLNVIITTEIIFNIMGYNGTVCKRMTEELFELSDAMNEKSRKGKIRYYYFSEIKQEVEATFALAEEIVQRRRNPIVGNNALSSIVEGCESKSDVVDKKTALEKELRDRNIKLMDTYDYYSSENEKYCLESSELYEKYGHSLNQGEPTDIYSSKFKERYIKHLSYINILRRGKNREDIKDSMFVLLTETRQILKISRDEFGEGREKSPLAVSEIELANRIWYDLNNGIGSRVSIPSSFSIFIKARIVLANTLSKKIGKVYQQQLKRYQEGELKSEELEECLIGYREAIKRPEEITRDDIGVSLGLITSEKDILELGKKREMERRRSNQAVEKLKKENLLLKKEKADVMVKMKRVGFLSCIILIVVIIFRLGVFLIKIFPEMSESISLIAPLLLSILGLEKNIDLPKIWGDIKQDTYIKYGVCEKE